MSGTLANQKYDEIPMWNRDKEWRCNLLAMMVKFQGGIETNWKCNENCICREIPMGKRQIFDIVEYSES